MAGDGFRDLASGPATTFDVITPADADLSRPIRALEVIDGGVVKVTTLAGDVRTTPTLPAGFIIKSGIVRVWATGTTAASLIGYP